MDFEELRKRLERLHRRMMEEIERGLEEAASLPWSPSGTMRPLYTLYEYTDSYVVLVDLAGADTSTLEVKATKDKLYIRASLERRVSFSDIYGTVIGRDLVFHSYEHEIPLPPDASPEDIKVKVRPNKIVEIVIPKKRERS